MGLISSIKEKFGVGGSGGSDPDMSIANEYREIQPEEIKSKPEPKEVDDTYEDVLAETGSYGTHVSKKIKGGISGIKKSAYSYAIRPFETEEEKGFRIKSEEQRKIEKATIGMNKQEKAAYEEAHLTQKRNKATEKAKRDVPIGETAEDREKRLQKKRERKEEVAHAYQKSRASAAGAEAGKSAPPSIFGMTRPEDRELRSPTSTGLVPHGFMPNVGMGAPGFEGARGLPPGTLYNQAFAPQPIPQPAPQPERRMTRREMHRQQVNEMTRKAVAEQQQQQMPSYLVPQTQPMRGYQPPKGRLPEQPRFRNLFEGHKPTNNNGKVSKGQDMPKMVNLFERPDVPTNTKIGKNQPNQLAEFSASLLGIGSLGTSKNGNGNKKSNRTKAPWEL